MAGQAVVFLIGGLAVSYHLCMRDDAKLLKKVREPARRKIQDFREWISYRFTV